MCNVALNKLIYLQWTLGDRNTFLPSILVPIRCKRGKRCNIIFVDVITVHVSLAKTAMASNSHSNTTKNISSNILPTHNVRYTVISNANNKAQVLYCTVMTKIYNI